MPIVASRGNEIRRLLDELNDPKRRAGAALRLRSLGARVVPHVAEDLARLEPESRQALLDALADVGTADARALKKRLARLEPDATRATATRPPGALDIFQTLPPPR